MTKPKLLSHASPIWIVRDMQRALDFYEQQLGFTINFKWQDPPTYATMSRDDIGIHLTLADDLPENYKSTSSLFIFVHDVDQVWKELQSKDVTFLDEIGDREYQMRDFDIVDPDGNRITFGQGLN